MTNLWDELGPGWIAVTKLAHLAAWFLRLGGNALIAEHLAEGTSPQTSNRMRLSLMAPPGSSPTTYEPDSRAVKARAPTPKQWMRILKREGYRCQICGERSSDNEHITHSVHHIRLFGNGGFTTDENLITLCHTCHAGLDPHYEPDRSRGSGGQRLVIPSPPGQPQRASIGQEVSTEVWEHLRN